MTGAYATRWVATPWPRPMRAGDVMNVRQAWPKPPSVHLILSVREHPDDVHLTQVTYINLLDGSVTTVTPFDRSGWTSWEAL